MDPVEGGCGSGGFPRSLVLVICPCWEAVGRSDQFLRAEGSEVQRKLFMGVRLRVPPALCGQITDGGRNLSELFYAFFFFSPACVTTQTQHFWFVAGENGCSSCRSKCSSALCGLCYGWGQGCPLHQKVLTRCLWW